MVNEDQISFFKKNGYLIIRDLLSPEQVIDLQSWAQEVHGWKPTETSEFMPYEEVNDKGETVLCRTENFADCHEGFSGLLRSPKLLGLLNDLAEEPMFLFKEKINYKLAGSGGFAPHIDSVAYTHIKDVKHLTILLSVDPSNLRNGGLEVVDGSHEMDVPINSATNCIESNWVDSQTWTPVELEAGQLLIFTSYLAHRSGANKSSTDRKAIYATYNRACEGDLRKGYYEHRKQEWPATHMRKAGKSYEAGALTYGFGSPMLSVDARKQAFTRLSRPDMAMEPPTTLTPTSVAEYVISVLQASENTPYIGEPISQLQHSLQCAAQAASTIPPVDEATQVAALLHDIGQFAPAKDLRKLTGGEARNLGGQSTGNSVGRVGHETLGGQLLLALGFPHKVARLVESHVAAKRYLCAVDEEYSNKLSDASKKSLAYQGGPMSGDERDKFSSDKWCKEMCQLRKWDDEAKIEGLEVRDLESWRPVLERQLVQTAGEDAA
ncbi:hypothetical protein V8C35DRAFT_333561 [Trichoderma chlorosporum]